MKIGKFYTFITNEKDDFTAVLLGTPLFVNKYRIMFITVYTSEQGVSGVHSIGAEHFNIDTLSNPDVIYLIHQDMKEVL